MIALPQLVVTDADITSPLPGVKAADPAEDFLALLAGALGADAAPGKDAPLSFADLQAASAQLQKALPRRQGETTPAATLSDLLAKQALQPEAELKGLEEAQQLLSPLTPPQKSSALSALRQHGERQDDKETTPGDDDLAALSALFAMLPGQPPVAATPAAAPADGDGPLNALLDGDARPAAQSIAERLAAGEMKKGEPHVTAQNSAAAVAGEPPFTPLAAAAAVKAEAESAPLPVTPGATLSAVTPPVAPAQPQPAAAAPVLSAPLGSHEWQQSLSQHVTLFTRQGQQSAELRLHPEELGQVHISLKLDDNQAQLQMVSAHSHVRAALEAALPVLRTQLAESGIQLGQSSISGESFAGQQHASSQQQPTPRTPGQSMSAADDDAGLVVPASLQAAARGNGAVDIFA